MKDTEPTERQIEYAKSLGIHITFDMTRLELSDLIDFTKMNDTKPTDRHFSFADFYDVTYTKYIGKKALFESISGSLSDPNRIDDRTSWFVFRVYRSLVKGREGTSILHPDDPIIQKISQELVKDSSFTNSLKRYDAEDTFLWFGEFQTSDGSYRYGTSKTTNSYKLASLELKKYPEVQADMELALNDKSKGTKTSVRQELGDVKDRESSDNIETVVHTTIGCLLLIGLVLILGFLVWIFF